jgi:hypothetical protein
MPYQYTLELSGFYQTASLLGMALHKGYGNFNLGLQKQLTQGKGTLRFSIEDLLWTMYLDLNYPPEKGFTRRLAYKTEPRILRLTYSANFGNKNLKGTKRSIASEEERKRVGN